MIIEFMKLYTIYEKIIMLICFAFISSYCMWKLNQYEQEDNEFDETKKRFIRERGTKTYH